MACRCMPKTAERGRAELPGRTTPRAKFALKGRRGAERALHARALRGRAPRAAQCRGPVWRIALTGRAWTVSIGSKPAACKSRLAELAAPLPPSASTSSTTSCMPADTAELPSPVWTEANQPLPSSSSWIRLAKSSAEAPWRLRRSSVSRRPTTSGRFADEINECLVSVASNFARCAHILMLASCIRRAPAACTPTLFAEVGRERAPPRRSRSSAAARPSAAAFGPGLQSCTKTSVTAACTSRSSSSPSSLSPSTNGKVTKAHSTEIQTARRSSQHRRVTWSRSACFAVGG